MQRREFLAKSCAAGVAAASGGALLAEEQSTNLQRNPGESDVAYRARLAQVREAQQAAKLSGAAVLQRQPGESDAAYRARLAQFRAAQRNANAAAGRIGTYYELRRYEIETEAQKAGLDKFLSGAAIDAWNGLGIQPVGVFYPSEGLSPIYVLLPHPSAASFVTLTQTLAEDQKFQQKGAEFINAPADKPAYKTMEVQFMAAFEAMPRLERPTEAPTRIFQLRTYESPSEKTGLKKIEMFNTAEIAIFRRVGLHPVFFGQTLAGTKMPNLTYMLGFQDMEESKANWKKFGGDPDWKKLSKMPEYMDKAILRNKGITNLYLKPASYSQI
ncbi:MAG: NIPSNAP family protein [Planctomycetes bacterium]|nr:NIPSNAP family protein [Planctomycetota bacterium]